LLTMSSLRFPARFAECPEEHRDQTISIVLMQNTIRLLDPVSRINNFLAEGLNSVTTL
jgi:hypothetical protein